MTVLLVSVDLSAMTAVLLREEHVTPRLSQSEMARAARMASGPQGAIAADQWRAAHVALRWVLEQHSETPPSAHVRQAEFETRPGGRPYLPGGLPSFSLSHGGGYAMIGVSTGGDVGVDVDGHRARALLLSADRKRHLVSIAAALMSERGHVPAAPSLRAHNDDAMPAEADDANAATLAAWVVIEAFAKAAGTGVGALLEACRHGVDEARLAPYRAWRGVRWPVRGDVVAAAAIPLASGDPDRLWLGQGHGGIALMPVAMAHGEAVDGTVSSGHKGRNGA